MSTCIQVIGTCRAVRVPGQDLAMPHLTRNCGKHILSLHCTLYVRLCMHILYAGDIVSSRPVLVVRVHMIRNNVGSAQVCLGLQAPIQVTFFFHTGCGKLLKKATSCYFTCCTTVVITQYIITSAGKHIPGCNCSRSAVDVCVLHIC